MGDHGYNLFYFVVVCFSPFQFCYPPKTLFLHAEATSTTGLGLLLQLVRDLLMRLEELGGATVEADGLALAEVAFAVRLVDALEGADLDHAVGGGV